MILTPESANHLCGSVISQYVSWRAFRAAMQSGGLEQKGQGRFADGIEKWLLDYEKIDLIVLPEYRNHGNTDFSLIDPLSVGKAKLSIDTLFEVKSNYASQFNGFINGQPGGHIGSQIRRAIEQVNNYRINGRRLPNGEFEACDGYIIHLVAEPTVDEIPGELRDTGWPYFNLPGMAQSRQTIAEVAGEFQWEILGEASSAVVYPNPPLLCCYLLRAML